MISAQPVDAGSTAKGTEAMVAVVAEQVGSAGKCGDAEAGGTAGKAMAVSAVRKRSADEDAATAVGEEVRVYMCVREGNRFRSLLQLAIAPCSRTSVHVHVHAHMCSVRLCQA